MLISDSGSDREFKLAPAGVHMALCYGIVDLGTQSYTYLGEQKQARQCRIMWELHGEDADGNPLALEDGRPLSLSQRYTLSLAEKAKLRKTLISWRGREFTAQELKRQRQRQRERMSPLQKKLRGYLMIGSLRTS